MTKSDRTPFFGPVNWCRSRYFFECGSVPSALPFHSELVPNALPFIDPNWWPIGCITRKFDVPDAYAKELFSNSSESKGGRSPYCLKIVCEEL
jgi:hypothetical protein